MDNFKKKRCLILLFINILFFSVEIKAQNLNPVLSENSKISILTIGPGNEGYSKFGHTAIRVKDSNFDLIFNYGTFDFSTEFFYAKFIRGNLIYHLSIRDYKPFIQSYIAEERDVVEQNLNLSLDQKQLIYNKLINDYKFNSKYTYRFIYKNCTTKTFDLLNNSLDLKKDSISFVTRKEVNKFLVEDPIYTCAVNILFGFKADKLNNLETSLPIHLYKRLSNDNNLIQSEHVLLGQKENIYPPTKTIDYTFLLISFSLLILFSYFLFVNKLGVYPFASFFGIIGLVLLAISLISLHKEVQINYNILLFNPFLIFFATHKKSKKVIYYLKIFILSLLVAFWVIFIMNWSYHSIYLIPLYLFVTTTSLKASLFNKIN